MLGVLNVTDKSKEQQEQEQEQIEDGGKKGRKVARIKGCHLLVYPCSCSSPHISSPMDISYT